MLLCLLGNTRIEAKLKITSTEGVKSFWENINCDALRVGNGSFHTRYIHDHDKLP